MRCAKHFNGLIADSNLMRILTCEKTGGLSFGGAFTFYFMVYGNSFLNKTTETTTSILSTLSIVSSYSLLQSQLIIGYGFTCTTI